MYHKAANTSLNNSRHVLHFIQGVNHFGHFLLVNLLLDDMKKAKDPRVCIVGSITGNTNTIGGGLVYPQANLGNLKGFEQGATKPVEMADGKPFFGAKAYKDSKVSDKNPLAKRDVYNKRDAKDCFSVILLLRFAT